MAILKVVHFPDDRLRVKCRPVAETEIDDKLRALAADMFDTMYDDEGIGLAAPQIGLDIRMVVIDIPEQDGTQGKNQIVLINPVITRAEGEVVYSEGCLSVPEYNAEVTRAERIQVRALDLNGQEQVYDADGLLAICMQHEIDHLDGRLFIDYLSSLKRAMLLKKYSKLKKEAQRNGVEY